jgi:hypothetical protein
VKSRLMVASAAGLLVMAGLAHSQSAPAPQQLAPQENAAARSAPAPSDTGTKAYGGTPDMRMQSGGKHTKPCSYDPQCNIFFGGS